MMNRRMLLLATACASYPAMAMAQSASPAATQPVATETRPTASATPAEEAAGGPSDSGEIVITAQKRSERLIDVPMSVAAISGSQLTKAGVISTLNISQTTPGVNTVNTGFGFIPVIRGIQSSGTSPGDESNVAVYVDDLSLGSPIAGFFDLADIERIEVLKGPQGTLFGRNATGGAIRIVTRKPSFKPGGDVSVDYGFRYQELRASGYVTGKLVDDVAGSLSATYRKGWDGFIKGVGPNDGRTYGKPDNYVFRGKLLFEPSSDFSAVAIAETSSSQNDSVFISMVPEGTNPYPGNGSVANTPFKYAGSTQPKARVKANGGSLDATWHPSDDVTLRSITGYRETSVQSQSDTDRTSRSVSSNQISQYQHNLSQELNLSSSGDRKIAWLLGAYYYHSIAGNPYFRQYSGDAPGGTIATNFTNRVTSEAVAGFGEVTFNLDKLHITAGGRYNSETKRFLYRDLVRATGLVTTVRRKTWNSFTYRGVVRYDIAQDANVYASVSNGFKSGVYNAYSSLGNPVDPEKVQAYEVGAKARVAGMTLTAAAYAYDYKDIQVSAYVTVNGQLVISLSNAATARMRGFELSADGRLNDHFSLNAGVGYEPTAKYSRYTNSQVVRPIPGAVQPVYAAIVVPYDSSGSQIVRTPKVTANLRVNYETPLFGGDFYATVSGSYSSRFFWQPGNFSPEKKYVVGNGRASWTTPGGRMSYSVWVNNLFDTRNHTDVTPNVLAGDSIKFLPKRQIGIGAAYKF